MQAFQDAKSMTANVHASLESRAVIEQARGVLMERHQMTADRAFHMLTQAAMATDTQVADVARHLVHTGELPLREAPAAVVGGAVARAAVQIPGASPGDAHCPPSSVATG